MDNTIRLNDPQRSFKLALLVLGGLQIAYFCVVKSGETFGIDGLLYPPGAPPSDARSPVGGDFINLWSMAKLVLSDRVSEIYRADAFMAYEQSLTGAPIGLRLWAYPPHSLLLFWPFGLSGFYVALAAWSLLSLALLFVGARRFGFDRLETAILLTSPATLLCLYYGQTGSIATGLLLLALSARGTRDPVSIGAAALLTVKPQAGFLLPLLWVFQRRWLTIAATAFATLALLAMAFAFFGAEPWRDYLGDTLPTLSLLEHEGSGPFMAMIPSAFMAVRILGGSADLADLIHAGFAVLVAAVLVVRLWQIEDAGRRSALVLIATVLMTPYLHNYDLALLLCGALLVARRWQGIRGVNSLVLVAWALPHIVMALNAAGLPISPLLILPLLLLA